VLARHQDELSTLARIGALGLDNLTIGFDNKSNSQGARLQSCTDKACPVGANLGNMLCDIVMNDEAIPNRKFTCELLKTIVQPFTDQLADNPSENRSQPAPLKLGGTAPPKTLAGLLGALKEGNES
jgi:hypothetical protein